MRGRVRLVGGLAAMAVALAVAPAAARDRVITVPTPAEPGPAQFNQVTVHQFGPASAKHVLVLMPGTQGGAGDFTLDARYLVKHDRGLQVWAIDRRTQALEDTSAFAAALRGQIPLQQAFDYYLGGRRLPLPGRQRRPLRPRVGDGGGPQRRPRRRPQGSRPRPPAGRPRRALARRLADRGLRRLGLQRPAGLQGPRAAWC